MDIGRSSPVWEPLEPRTHLSAVQLATVRPAAIATASLPIPMNVVASATQPDGKDVICGYVYTGTVVNFEPVGWGTELAVARLNADGTLDATFGTGGVATVADQVPTDTNVRDESATAVAIEPDGDIVAVGLSQTAYGNVGNLLPMVVRFTPQGQLDPTFGSAYDGLAGGVYQPALVSAVAMPGVTRVSRLDAVAVLPDGGLVVAGTVYGPFNAGMETDSAIVLDWVTPQGTRDDTHGAIDPSQPGGHTGDLVLPIGSTVDGEPRAAALALAAQPDGKVVVAGKAPVGDRPAFAIARTTPDGSGLDPTFGTGGVATLRPAGAIGGAATDVVVLSNGDILAAGMVGTGTTAGTVASRAVLAQFTPVGKPDGAFGTNGTTTTAVGRLVLGAKLAPGPGGTTYLSAIVGAEDKKTGLLNASAAILNYSVIGRLDTVFGSNGIVAVPVSFTPDNSDGLFNPVDVRMPGNFGLDSIQDDFPTSRTETAAPWGFPISLEPDGRPIVIGGLAGFPTTAIATSAAPVADPAVTAAVPATSAAVTAGRTATVVVTVTNAGTGVANGPATLTLTADGVAVPLATHKMGLNLAPGRSMAVRLTFRVPVAFAGQTVSLTATLAAGSGLADADPTNDRVTTALAVG